MRIRLWLMALATCVPATVSGAEISKMALVGIDVTTEVDAPAARVWSILTDPAQAPSWCPLWSSPGSTAERLDEVGSTIHYRDEYGNEGRSVILYVEAPRELRIAHVPDNGSYVCQASIKLVANGRKTTLAVTEQYSDQLDVPIDRDTATSTRDTIEKYVAALKSLAESK